MMGRLVRKPQAAEIDLLAGLEDVLQSGGNATTAAQADLGDGYLERMVKYVPAEIIAFFMLINAILGQAMQSGGPNAAMAGIPVPIIATIVLVIACALTPVFCWYVRREGDAWVVNAVVSTIALPFWAYLMGAVAFANFHDGDLAAILVMSFTVVSGLVAPRAEKPKLRQQAAEATPRETPRLVNALAG
jgi:heme/copper-type cytochrome/quinol oxidase subunit 3